MRFGLLLLIGSSFLGGAAAQQPTRLPPGAPVQPDGRVVLSREFCQQMVAHSPAPDVNYQPGVDARGRAVAPADLPSTEPRLATGPYVTDILVDTRRYPSLPPRSETRAGQVVVAPDGSVTFNGQPLGGGQQSDIAQMCQRVLAP